MRRGNTIQQVRVPNTASVKDIELFFVGERWVLSSYMQRALTSASESASLCLAVIPHTGMRKCSCNSFENSQVQFVSAG